MNKNFLSIDLIEKAYLNIKNKILKTPLEYSDQLSALLQVPVLLKLESQQLTGSFKIRGAYFYLSTLSECEKSKGIAACSAGNHGLGVAYAAKQMGLNCTIYVPKYADEIKCTKILNLGSQVIRSQYEGYDETLDWTKEETAKTGHHLISAFDDERIMAGNGGTLALEILEALPNVKNVIFPVGGGGLAAGMAFYLKTKIPDICLIGCQHSQSPALKISLEKGIAITHLPSITTVASGIEGGIGATCFDVVKNRIDKVALLEEKEIYQALCWTLEHHQMLIEPSAAVTIAAAIASKLPKLAGQTVILLSGRNVSYKTIKKIIYSS